jgi:hypothetical protein
MPIDTLFRYRPEPLTFLANGDNEMSNSTDASLRSSCAEARLGSCNRVRRNASQ